jgi:D-lyxose ketol-isomerase
VVELAPGESIGLAQFCYHRFWGIGSKVLAGEVSMVNDDSADNRFLKAGGRLPAIEEDEAPPYLLCTDYRNFYRY